MLEALQRATQHAKQLAEPEVQGHGRLHLVDDHDEDLEARALELVEWRIRDSW